MVVKTIFEWSIPIYLSDMADYGTPPLQTHDCSGKSPNQVILFFMDHCAPLWGHMVVKTMLEEHTHIPSRNGRLWHSTISNTLLFGGISQGNDISLQFDHGEHMVIKTTTGSLYVFWAKKDEYATLSTFCVQDMVSEIPTGVIKLRWDGIGYINGVGNRMTTYGPGLRPTLIRQ